jgi:putative membrane protein
MMPLRRPRSVSAWVSVLSWSLYAVMWAGGVISYLALGGVGPGDEWTAPLFLTLAGLIVLVSAGRRPAVALLLAGLLGFVAEWIGLRGRWLFGEYVYTDVLWPSIAGVPVVMTSAWMVLVAYVRSLASGLPLPVPLRIAAGAGLLTAIDLVIDPLASGPLGYWVWRTGGAFHGVPVQNFAGWFAVGAVILAVTHLVARDAGAVPAARPVGLSIVLFFTVLAAGFGLAAPALAGGLVCAVHAWLAGRTARWPAAGEVIIRT